MARPPMSKFISTMITEAPFSRAAIAAGSPLAPAPMMTTSASRSQRIGSCACAGVAAIVAAAPATAAPEVRKPRRSIEPGVLSEVWSAAFLRDCDILAFLPVGAGIIGQKLRCPIQQGQSGPGPGSPAVAQRQPGRSRISLALNAGYGMQDDREGNDWERGRADRRGRDHRPLLPAAGQASGGLRAHR